MNCETLHKIVGIVTLIGWAGVGFYLWHTASEWRRITKRMEEHCEKHYPD